MFEERDITYLNLHGLLRHMRVPVYSQLPNFKYVPTFGREVSQWEVHKIKVCTLQYTVSIETRGIFNKYVAHACKMDGFLIVEPGMNSWYRFRAVAAGRYKMQYPIDVE